MTRRNTPRISFIGFGEAGQAVAAGLCETGVERIAVWDILFPERDGARLKAAGETRGVRCAASAADAVAEADLVVSAVTAASSLDAARSAAPARPRAMWTWRWWRRSTRRATARHF
jgi:3-hydroxyisobutyrate dehydrogenase-like beta-hydroxyacid dehydrogenase